MSSLESDLAGKTALVTGAGVRLGRATALTLSAEGINVVAHYNASRDGAEETASEARAVGVEAWTVQADLDDETAVNTLFDRAVAAAGAIDILINNASIFPGNRLADFTRAELDTNVRINAMAPLIVARAFVAQFEPSGALANQEGAIVNFLDTRISEYDRNHVAYHLSKRMLHSLTRIMAIEFAPEVRVNAVAPGLILPPPDKDEAYLEKLARRIPLQRTGSAGDVTDAVVYLLRSRFVTGQVLFVDGGQNLNGSVYG